MDLLQSSPVRRIRAMLHRHRTLRWIRHEALQPSAAIAGEDGDGLPVAGGRADAESALEDVVGELGPAVAVGTGEVDRGSPGGGLVAVAGATPSIFSARGAAGPARNVTWSWPDRIPLAAVNGFASTTRASSMPLSTSTGTSNPESRLTPRRDLAPSGAPCLLGREDDVPALHVGPDVSNRAPRTMRSASICMILLRSR